MALYYLKAHMGQYYFFHEKMLHGKIKNRESLSKYLAKGHIDYTYNLTLETKKDLAISATQTLVEFLFSGYDNFSITDFEEYEACMEMVQSLFPKEVLDVKSFIMRRCIKLGNVLSNFNNREIQVGDETFDGAISAAFNVEFVLQTILQKTSEKIDLSRVFSLDVSTVEGEEVGVFICPQLLLSKPWI